MTMRQTPFERIRYPWATDVVAAADLQAMGSDIDQQLVNYADLAAGFTKLSTVVAKRAAVVSLTKATLTTMSFDTVVDNGASSPLSSGAWWNAANPTRLTAPQPCIVLAAASGGINSGSAMGSPAAVQVTVHLNGATGAPGAQGTKFQPLSTQSGQIWASSLSMWKLIAGDYLDLRMYWTGTPAGPINTDTVLPPVLSLMMVALPSVP